MLTNLAEMIICVLVVHEWFMGVVIHICGHGPKSSHVHEYPTTTPLYASPLSTPVELLLWLYYAV